MSEPLTKERLSKIVRFNDPSTAVRKIWAELCGLHEQVRKLSQPGAEVKWVDPAVELPDDETTVLIEMEDGEVWTGFRDAGEWRYVSADLVEGKVVQWAHFPEPRAGRQVKAQTAVA